MLQARPGLKEAAAAFATSVDHFEKKFGIIALGEPVSVESPLVLGEALGKFYSRLDLRDKPGIGGKMHIKIFPPSQLPAAQEGWRWIVGRDGQRIEDPGWPVTWIVFADRNGDAIVVDTASPRGAVYGSIQKRSFPISADLASFLQTLALAMDEERARFDYEVLDEDFEVLDSYRSVVESIAQDRLGGDYAHGFMKFFF